MTNDIRECPHCKGRMEEGFLLDRTYGANLATTWVGGAPEHSFWTGVRIKGRRRHSVRTFRCTACGLLASYAR